MSLPARRLQVMSQRPRPSAWSIPDWYPHLLRCWQRRDAFHLLRGYQKNEYANYPDFYFSLLLLAALGVTQLAYAGGIALGSTRVIYPQG